jgi:toxin-antitoxin system PIN domain toxin
MILPDVNLLVYAYNSHAPQHDVARDWWERLLNDRAAIGMPWAVAMGFVRVVTNPRATPRPLDGPTATRYVRSWLIRSHVESLHPGPRHLDLLEDLLAGLGVAGRMTTDAHLAALAIEYNAELHSNDADFSRFAGLRWRNPLAGP